MNHKIKIYLAGTIYDDGPDAIWKSSLINHFEGDSRFLFYDPKPQLETEQYMVLKDKSEIRNCDIFVAYMQLPTVGTSMEILYAYENQKPVFVINPNGSLFNNLWLEYHMTIMCNGVSDCANHIVKYIEI